jgi:hypothetical protein
MRRQPLPGEEGLKFVAVLARVCGGEAALAAIFTPEFSV